MRTTGRDLHIDIPLTRVALQFRPEGMIADKIFPIVPVGKQSDSYLIWSSADAFRTEDDRRSPNNEANVIERTVSSDTYFAKNYALKMPITLEDQKNMDAAYVDELRNGRVTYIKTKLMFNWEKRIANQVTSTSNVGSSSAVTSAWTDYTTGESDPMGDIWTALANVQDATGYAPNRIVFGDSAWRNFRRHADVVNIIHGNDGAGSGRSRLANMEQVKGIFELEDVLIGRAYHNTADEGQSQNLNLLWGDNVLVYYAPMQPTKEAPSFGYSFRWVQSGIPQMQAEVHPYDTRRKSDEVELGYYQNEKITAKQFGFLITAVTSAT